MKRKIQKLQILLPYYDNDIVVGREYKGQIVLLIEKTIMGTFVSFENGTKIEICNTPFMIFYKDIHDTSTTH